MSKAQCIKCKTDIKQKISQRFHHQNEIAVCPNKKCKLSEKPIYQFKLEEIEEQVKLKFISSIRLEFDKYWKIYCNKYDKITGGKYEEYQLPIKLWGSNKFE